MKKVLAALIALVILLSFAGVVSADGNETTTGGSSTLNFSLSESYTVTFPGGGEAIDITKASKEIGDVVILKEGFLLGEGKHLEVTVKSDNYNSGWYLKTTAQGKSATLGYSLKVKGATDDLANEGLVVKTDGATLTADVKATLVTEVNGTPSASGSYQDILTFTVTPKDTSS